MASCFSDFRGYGIGETEERVPRDDDVVGKVDVEEPARLSHLLGCIEVFPAGLGISRDVVVDDDDSGGIVQQGPLDNHPRVDGGVGQRAFREHFTGNRAVVHGQEQDPHLLVVEVCHVVVQEVHHV